MSDQQIKQILEHLRKQDLKIEEINKKMDEQNTVLEPIAKTYENANALKRFAFAAIISAGTIAGSIVAVRELIRWR